MLSPLPLPLVMLFESESVTVSMSTSRHVDEQSGRPVEVNSRHVEYPGHIFGYDLSHPALDKLLIRTILGRGGGVMSAATRASARGLCDTFRVSACSIWTVILCDG